MRTELTLAVLAAAMQAAGSADPKQYLPALKAIQYQGAPGKVSFDDKGDRQNAALTRQLRVIPTGTAPLAGPFFSTAGRTAISAPTQVSTAPVWCGVGYFM